MIGPCPQHAQLDASQGCLVGSPSKGGPRGLDTVDDKPRVAEVPFDSEYKFMATFHRWTDREGRDVVGCFRNLRQVR